jgi:uncharacterized protein YndB with AHSA1/START domain
MSAFPHSLESSVVIRAEAATVFAFFTDSARFADWWGAGSTIEGRPGGRLKIVYPGGTTASGEVVEMVANQRIVFTYGYDAPDKAIPPGGSLVTVRLEAVREGTLVTLCHELADRATRDEHVQGWRYQMAVFANAAARAQHAGVAALVDRYLAAWSEADPARLAAGLAVVSDAVTFRDQYGCTRGRDALATHIAAVQRFMPGMTLTRRGDVRQCQGAALVDWTATAPDGQPRGEGTNALELAPDGRIAGIVGFWKA